MVLLELKEVKKKFKRKLVLDNFSLSLDNGEILGLIGRSGCGKSTLLKIIVGMTSANSGKIYFDGKNALWNLKYLRKNTGFATQENMIFDELTIKENSFYFGKLYGMRKKDIIINFKKLISLLELVGYEKTLAKNLSGGMLKRANILVSLIHNPKLLILDEPTVGLDPGLRKILWNYIHEINKSGTTIIVTSHLLEEIQANTDRIAIMNSGKIVSIGSYQDYQNHFPNSRNLNEIFETITR